MAKSKSSDRLNLAPAIQRIHGQWSRMSARPGVDRIAKAAAMSNNSVLDLTSVNRSDALLNRLHKDKTGAAVRTWARLAMQLAIVLRPLQDSAASSHENNEDGIVDWVRADEWGLTPTEFIALLDEARVKIDGAQEQLTGTVRADLVRIGIVPLVYLADDIRPDRERTGSSTSASFLGAFGHMALRSVKPDFEFTHYSASLRDLSSSSDSVPSSAVKVGVFGIVSRERDVYEHIPIPGWAYKIACVGPDIPRVRHAAERRHVFASNQDGFVYMSLKESSPSSFLTAMFGKSLSQRHLQYKGRDDFDYDAKQIASAYADELTAARSAIRADDHGPIPLLVIDDAMADEVARRIGEIYSTATLWSPPRFVDLLRGVPEGPVVPICIQVRRADEDLVRALKHAIVGDRSKAGEVFSLGALPVARVYARALVWILSRYAYDYASGPGVPSPDSLLLRVQAFYRDCVSSREATPPAVPTFCRLWGFGDTAALSVRDGTQSWCSRTKAYVSFVHLLADELLCRLLPPDLYERVLANPSSDAHRSAVKRMLSLLLPGCGPSVDTWSHSRLTENGVRLPAIQDDWRDGPVNAA